MSYPAHPRGASTFRWLALLLLSLVAATELDAQYFGRNNPQYRTFDFQVLRTEHFDIYYYPEAEEGVRDAARMAERWYTRLSRILGHEFRERQPLILYASHADFQQTNILSSPVGEGTGGVTESAKQRVIMPLAHTYGDTDHVLGHELVHAFQYDISGLGRSAGSIDAGGRALVQAPLWFIEGMAEYLTLGPIDTHTSMWLRDAALTGQIPSLRQLATDPRIFPYRYGHALWAYIAGRWGDAVVGEILRSVGGGVPYQQAMQNVLNVTPEELSSDWQAAIRRTYLPLLAELPEARQVGTPLITRDLRGGRMNVGPAVSPDGTRVAFLSERGRLDVELWLADAQTGEILRRLVRGPALDPHFGSLNFIISAGTFSPDGSQLAFSALRRGQNVVALVDVARGGVTRQITVPGIPEITNPTWSPDGSTIVFAGTQGGITNLFALDLRSEQVRQLTTGRNADLLPAYSPDGTRVAFVTDRGPGTDMDILQLGPYRIAILDIATGGIDLLPEVGGQRNYNPTWAPDGQSVYFISDRSGIANLYRQEIATGTVSQVTDIFQGVSGITPLSPALSGARSVDRLVFSVFEANGYNLYRLDDGGRLAGVPVPVQEVQVNGVSAPLPAVLPPSPRPPEAAFHRVTNYLEDPLDGLPSLAVAAAWTPEPYRPRLTLDYLGQPQIGFTTGGALGQGGLYGGIAGVFSDMLAHHTIFGVVQAQGELEQVGFTLAYLYRPLRWDLGVAAQRIPYISAGTQRVLEGGLLRDQVVSFRTFDTSLQGLAQLPLSKVQRVEFSSGVRRMARDIRIQEVVYDPIFGPGGQLIGGANPRFQDQRENVDDFHFAEASAALVFDNALFGFTAPFAGQRYRFEASPTLGSLNFLSALADFRRYLWLQPFTVAGRGMHFGRYGLDAEEERQVGQIYLGQPMLMRGYDYGSIVSRCLAESETAPGTRDELVDQCSILNSLFGNRIAVLNAELRFPLIRALVLGTGIGFPPIEGFAFYDAGVAWGQGVTPVFATGIQDDPARRGFLSSAGVGARVNLLGFAILEIDYVRPLVGDRGWHWQFALQPGF